MLLNYLKVALRHAKRHQVYALLNLAGLVFAFAAFGLILIYRHYETGFEDFHSQASNIFRLSHREVLDNGNTVHWARTHANFVNELPRQVPEVKTLIRFQNQEQKYVRVGQEKFKPQHAYITDASVFEVFDFPFMAGDPQTALANPNSVVLTASLAKTWFGQEDVVGKTLSICGNFSPEETPHTITGVMYDLPPNTHLPVDMLISFRDSSERSWWAYVYILLSEGAKLKTVEEKTADFIKNNRPEGNQGQLFFDLQPIKDIHLHSDLAREIVPNGDARYVKIVSFAGIFILIIAIINYLNLSSALAISRSREMGMRRILGAGRGKLVAMGLTESVSYTFIATGLSLGLIRLIFPWFQSLTGAYFIGNPWVILSEMAAIALVCGLIAGIYPAYVLLNTGNTEMLRARLTRSGKDAFALRRILVAVQFGLAILLSGSAMVAWAQFRYINEKNLGITRQQVLAIPGVPDKVTEAFPLFRDRVSRLPGVVNVAACMEVPSREIRDMGPIVVLGRNPQEAPVSDVQVISPGFVETMGLEIIAGEDRSGSVPFGEPPQFTPKFPPEQYLSARPRTYMLNETAMRLLGWQNPDSALGQQINWSISNFQLATGPVTAIVKDYHQETLKNKIDPLVFLFEPIWLRTFLIKVETEDIQQTLSRVEEVWDEIYPSYPMDYHFLDELYEDLYKTERVQLRLLAAVSILAIFIAFMGLVSLLAWSLRTRMREIAIRRVMGARAADLVLLLGREYLVMLAAGAVLAIPLSYNRVSDWLTTFAYHTDISFAHYFWPVTITAALLGATVYFQTLKATKENPADTLRDE
ncbi:MAG: FtsX-like permease family protein [Bacteroidia bacterium]|nr:FtsX-like permease family protein [Bacteroidia bacterium]